MDTYKFIGYQCGNFTDENGVIRNYATIFATLPVGNSHERYQAEGLKACVLKCVDSSVITEAMGEVGFGDDVNLYFNEWKKVALMKSAK